MQYFYVPESLSSQVVNAYLQSELRFVAGLQRKNNTRCRKAAHDSNGKEIRLH